MTMPEHFSVSGRVIRPDGTAVPGIPVSAFQRRLRSEQVLGEVTTTADGAYRIEYPPSATAFDLVVRARLDGEPVTQMVLPAAAPDENVDLTLPDDQRAEYDRLLADVSAHLDGTAIDDLVEGDFGYLARATGHDAARIADLAAASRKADEAGTSAEQLYGLLRQGLPTDSPDLAEGGPIAEIFAAAVPDAEVRDRLYAAYLDRTPWDQLTAEESIAGDVDRVRLALELGRLTDDNPPLVSALLTKFDDGELSHPRDLVRLHDQWDTLVDAGDSVDTAAVADRVAETYPTAHLGHQLSARSEHADAASTRFLADNPEFDLVGTPVNDATVPDADARQDLAEIQRTFKIAPRFEAMQTLRDNGFTSSYAVASIGRDAFASQVSDTIGEEEAHAVHARAIQVHATAVNLVADLRTAGHFDVPWLPKVEALTDQIPNWEELFGPADYGSFEECRSVYSQAAYLVDLMYYLRRLGGVAPGWPQDGPIAAVLQARRPDLWDVQLSCDNTDLALPYVDLVNELLESAVAPDTAIPATARQSSGDSAQLRIQPQHVNAGAYEKLRTAVYPWDLPFDLWREQTNAYLAHLTVTRASLIGTIGAAPGFPDLLADEQLGLNTVAARIIAGEPLTPARNLAEYYGRPATTDPATLVAEMRRVRTLLDAGSLRYADLTALLDTRFVNPDKSLVVRTDAEFPYDTTRMTLEGLDQAALERLHRFARLRRALGWPATLLDRVINGRLDRTTLRGITALRALSARLGLSVDELLVFHDPLETRVYQTDTEPPQYDQLFLDPAVVTPLPDAPSPFALRPDRTELNVLGSLETPAVTAALLGVLEVSDEDLAALITGPRSVTPTRVLDLANLSSLVRTVRLAKALSLSIPDLLRLIELSGQSPFSAAPYAPATESELAAGAPMLLPGELPPPYPPATESELAAGAPMLQPVSPPRLTAPARTLAGAVDFLDAVEAVQAAGFTVTELDAVLAGAALGPDDTRSAALSRLRSALQSVFQQTADTTDDTGDLTRKQLTLLGWDLALAEDAVATLLGAVTYTAPLAALPETVVFPADIPVRYDATDERLQFTGPMTTDQHDRLEALLPADENYLGAVQTLHDAPRNFVVKRMKALRLPVYSAGLAAMPPDYPMPKSLVGKVFFDISDHTLKSRGYLSQADVDALLAPVGQQFDQLKAAVKALQDNQEGPVKAGNAFLTASDAAYFFDSGTVTPAMRFERVLGKANPVLRQTLSEITVRQHVGQAAGLDPATTDRLLGSPTVRQFLSQDFVGSDPAVPVTRTGFGPQFTALDHVQRIARVLTRLRITAEEIPFVFGYASSSGWLDLDALPTGPVAGPSPLFGAFVRLLDLIRLRSTLPGGARTLTIVFGTARAPGATADQVVTELARQTGWNKADVARLASHFGVLLPTGFTDVPVLLKLLAGVRLGQRLGVAAERMVTWLGADLDPDAARAAWQAAKAQHTFADWPVVAAPMQDAIRERQRSALVAYLAANPLPATDGTPHWRDPNGLHAYFLLDVEMGPTQLTTRIAQAAYSVQLFVQRCLLNLEPQVSDTNSEVWQQWAWMKQYRTWEANQKVFLYPENYFEPDLRADKSPFFAEFETDMMQKEVTDPNSEAALLRYLEGVEDVARLQPCGMYDYKASESWEPEYKRYVYVFARSESTPRTYYFRTWIYHEQRWTPWEKISLDIDSDTVVPVVWQKRLFLFWLTFTPVADSKTVSRLPDGTTENEISERPRFWNIHLNWSRYVNKQWQPKKVVRDTLSTSKARILDPRYQVWTTDRYDEGDTRRWIVFPDSYESGDLYVGAAFNEQLTYWDYRFGQEFGLTANGEFVFSALRGAVTVHPVDNYGSGPAMAITPPPGTATNNNEFVEHPQSETTPLTVPENPYAYPSPDPGLIPVLGKTPGPRPFRLLFPRQNINWATNFSLFFTDSSRCYFLDQKTIYFEDPATGEIHYQKGFLFTPFYHPHVEEFVGRLEKFGLDGLYARHTQLVGEQFDFRAVYEPVKNRVVTPYPGEPVDFEPGTPYSQYNWELFFHAPLFIAERLSDNQQFAPAQEWFHRIFDPMNRDDLPAPQRFWKTKPFYLMSADGYQQQRIESILKRLAEGAPAEELAVKRWLANPFQPDVVAQLRTTAYQKAVVMKYLDNLIAWGDQLFRQDTMESINQATQLYILASELLGRRPDEVKDSTAPPPKSYRDLIGARAQTAAAVTATENLLPAAGTSDAPAIAPEVGTSWLSYFRIPRNEKLVGYWDIVADRLFKIRHGLNIEGVERQLALFGVPIDPGVLVKAASAGVDLSAALDDINAPRPHYRFAPMAAKAKELAAEVKSFGAALLAALEKRDAEALARLRSSHEIALLDAARAVREQQIAETDHGLEATKKSKDIAKDKRRYYASREQMNPKEKAHTRLATDALRMQEVSAAVDMTLSVLALLPEFKVGSPMTLGATFGGANLAGGLKGVAASLQSIAGAISSRGSLAATVGGYDRRWDDWQFQSGQAQIEMDQFDKQIAAAGVRKAVAEMELRNHDRQRANARDADRFMREKYTNQELYEWMVGQLSTSYIQAYQLAYDVAKRAERAYRHELGVDDSSFIKFGYWDSLHKGLLAGERLAADLNRLDAAFLEANARELEMSKRISLAQFDPKALLTLKETGKCFVSLPEALFDLDTPGHYLRRIKTVSITVPCVAGPYTGVNLTARLLRSSVRVDSRLSGDRYARQKSDTRFRDFGGPIESIVTSTGQEDSGLFETNLRDERFLPFEGAGVISEWQLSLPDEFRQFDYESITDVVLHLRYTARDAGDALAGPAVDELRTALTDWVHTGGGKGLFRTFSARREFADGWNRFLDPTTDEAKMTFTLSKSRFPYLFRDELVTVENPQVVLVLSHDLIPDGTKRYVDCYDQPVTATLTGPGVDQEAKLHADPNLAGLPRGATQGIEVELEEADQGWTVSVPTGEFDTNLFGEGRFNPAAVLDVLLLCQYDLKQEGPS